jgi:NADH dehydrogenase FAD-containing subunit
VKERHKQTDILILADKIQSVKIALIDRNASHFITPLLHEVAIASIHSDHIKRPLRVLVNERNDKFHQCEIGNLDLENQTVAVCTNCASRDNLPKCDHNTYINKADFISDRRQVFRYDYLALAMGNYIGRSYGSDIAQYGPISGKIREETSSRKQNSDHDLNESYKNN